MHACMHEIDIDFHRTAAGGVNIYEHLVLGVVRTLVRGLSVPRSHAVGMEQLEMRKDACSKGVPHIKMQTFTHNVYEVFSNVKSRQ